MALTNDQQEAATNEIAALKQMLENDRERYYGTAGRANTFDGEGIQRVRRLVAKLAPHAGEHQALYAQASSLPQG